MTVIEVIRRPAEPNVIYHVACYTPKKGEGVLGVLRLAKDAQCGQCGKIIPAGAVGREEKKSV